jgi:rubrerythrin
MIERKAHLWRCPECGAWVNLLVNGWDCPYCDHHVSREVAA